MAEHPARGDRTALLVVDMLNPYEHEDAERLAESVGSALPQITGLVERARAEEALVVYVNDNHGDWNTSAEKLVKKALEGRYPALVEPVLPAEDDPFVLKTRHSVFYSSPLEYLLESREIGRIVLSGQVTEQCILYSAVDGYVGHFEVAVARDAVAHIHQHLAEAAFEMMERNMHAEVSSAGRLRLGRQEPAET
jgi:nicotinamidase-related amidase